MRERGSAIAISTIVPFNDAHETATGRRPGPASAPATLGRRRRERGTARLATATGRGHRGSAAALRLGCRRRDAGRPLLVHGDLQGPALAASRQFRFSTGLAEYTA